MFTRDLPTGTGTGKLRLEQSTKPKSVDEVPLLFPYYSFVILTEDQLRLRSKIG